MAGESARFAYSPGIRISGWRSKLTARVCRTAFSLAVVFACGVFGPRAASHAGSAGIVQSAVGSFPALTTVRLGDQPAALVDDAARGRVFVVVSNQATQDKASVVMLRARDGKVLGSTTLTATNEHLPASVACPSCVALDERSGRVFVLSRYLVPATGNTTGPAYAFMLDAGSGRILSVVALSPNDPAQAFPPAILVDERTNRVFSTSGPNNCLSVLDATTGKLLHTVVFPTQGRDALAVLPLGVDRHDGGVLVEAPDGLVLVDERTGKPLRAIHLPDNQGFEDGLVDGQHGRAVLAVNVDQNDNFVNTVETVNLATGKLLSGLGGPKTVLLLALDERTGRALVLEQSSEPPMLRMLDDRTREETPGIPLYTQGVTGAINPTTGHGLVLSSSGMLVVDLRTGALLANHNLALGVLPANATRALVVDAATKHVFVSNPTDNTVIMLDASKF